MRYDRDLGYVKFETGETVRAQKLGQGDILDRHTDFFAMGVSCPDRAWGIGGAHGMGCDNDYTYRASDTGEACFRILDGAWGRCERVA